MGDGLHWNPAVKAVGIAVEAVGIAAKGWGWA